MILLKESQRLNPDPFTNTGHTDKGTFSGTFLGTAQFKIIVNFLNWIWIFADDTGEPGLVSQPYIINNVRPLPFGNFQSKKNLFEFITAMIILSSRNRRWKLNNVQNSFEIRCFSTVLEVEPDKTCCFDLRKIRKYYSKTHKTLLIQKMTHDSPFFIIRRKVILIPNKFYVIIFILHAMPTTVCTHSKSGAQLKMT